MHYSDHEQRKLDQASGAELDRIARKLCDHAWTPWKEIGRTGDWFHPLICRRECTKCKAQQTEDI